MTRAEFEAIKATYPCKFCGVPGMAQVEESVGNAVMHAGGKLVCWSSMCNGRFLVWLAKEQNGNRRPSVKPGEVDAVWREYGNVCAVCNLTAEQLDLLGIERTRQHVPAFKTAGETGKLLPFCGWCQARAAAEMKRMETLVGRIAKRLSLDDRGRDDAA